MLRVRLFLTLLTFSLLSFLLSCKGTSTANSESLQTDVSHSGIQRPRNIADTYIGKYDRKTADTVYAEYSFILRKDRTFEMASEYWGHGNGPNVLYYRLKGLYSIESSNMSAHDYPAWKSELAEVQPANYIKFNITEQQVGDHEEYVVSAKRAADQLKKGNILISYKAKIINGKEFATISLGQFEMFSLLDKKTPVIRYINSYDKVQ